MLNNTFDAPGSGLSLLSHPIQEKQIFFMKTQNNPDESRIQETTPGEIDNHFSISPSETTSFITLEIQINSTEVAVMIDYTKETKLSVKSAADKLTEDLKANKWGVLGVIDVKKILAEKLNVESEDYMILDVCNPVLAHQGLSINKQVGLILPCKLVVYSDKGRKISLYRPTVALSTASSLPGYDKLKKLAAEAEDGLKKVIDLQ